MRRSIRSFVLANFLPGEAPETLTDGTNLITTGVIASLSMLELVGYLENAFGVNLGPDDVGVARMDSIELLVDLVMAHLGREGA